LKEGEDNGDNEDIFKAWINNKWTRKKNCYESLDQQGIDNGIMEML